MGTGNNALYSPEDIKAMRREIENIDAQLANIDKIKQVNQKAKNGVFELGDEQERLEDLKDKLNAILSVFG